MKIGFYLQNDKISGIDCTRPLEGNPGIGGTEYMFVAIPYALQCLDAKHRHHEIVLFANDISCLPHDMPCVKVSGSDELAQIVLKGGVNLLVMRPTRENCLLADLLPRTTQVVMWAHNAIKRQDLTALIQHKNVSAIVCVGREQLHIYRDHRAYRKSVVIPNGYPVNHFLATEAQRLVPFGDRKNEVTFLGNLVEYKGFHLLAQAWKAIVREVPDAHLNVIGGGRLYDRSQKLGRYHIAEQSYEEQFMPHLLGDDGQLLPSVKFWGVMGQEKAEVLNHTKVGVPNPSGVSETFCIAALEMQLYGSVVTTINYGGFKDSVYPATGLLYDTPDQLAQAVVKQLRQTDNDYAGFADFAQQYDFATVVPMWQQLFDALETGNLPQDLLKPAVPPEHKLLERNRRLKQCLPLGAYLPTMAFYHSIGLRINRVLDLLRLRHKA